MWLKLTEAHVLQEYKLTIGNKELVPNDIRGLEIIWQLNELYTIGEVTFIDSIGMLEHAPTTALDELVLFWKDGLNETYTQTFYVTDIKEVRSEKAHVMAAVRFVDRNTISFLNTFKSYGDSKGDVAIMSKNLINEFKVDKEIDFLIDGSKLWRNLETGDSGQHAVPGDRSLLNLLYRWKAEKDYIVYNNREKIVLTDWKKLLEKDALEYKLFLQPENIHYVGKIGDLYAQTADALTANTIMPDLEITYLSHIAGGKVPKTEAYTYNSAINQSGRLGTRDIHWVKSNGTHNIAIKNHLSDHYYSNYKKYVNNMILLEVVIPGWTKRDVGEIVEISIETRDVTGVQPDENMMGKWLIVKMIDKVNQGFFTQKLSLARSVQN